MKTGRVGLALLALAALVSLLWTPAAKADSNARIVRLSYVDGNVQVDRGAGMGFERAFLNQPIIQGSRVWTKDDGRAEIEFEGSSTLRLAPNTYVDVQELGMRGSGDRYSTIEVQDGTVYVDFQKHHDDEFRLLVSGHEIEFPKSGRARLTVNKNEVQLAVFKGSAEVPSDGKKLDARKGETLTLDLTDTAHYNLAKNIQAEPEDDWAQSREQFNQQYSSGSGYSGYSSAYSYGISDLNYWGGYNYVPGWGMLWQPYGMSPGWDPYMDGAWMWYPGYGYMWVSAYPWGWMPYRYGTWMFVPGYGWCWQPATYWNTWYPVSVVRNAPPQFRQPTPPAVTSPPHPGTTPPRTVNIGRGPSPVFPEIGPKGRPMPRITGATGAGTTTTTTVAPSGGTAATPSRSGTAVKDPDAVVRPRGRTMEEVGTPDAARRGRGATVATPPAAQTAPAPSTPATAPAPAPAPAPRGTTTPAPHPSSPPPASPRGGFASRGGSMGSPGFGEGMGRSSMGTSRGSAPAASGRPK